jgi:pimeloyl-ACP methyl ester carboxylesterase
MPRVEAKGVELYFESMGEGTTLLLHGHHHQWYMPYQVPCFSQFYSEVVFDPRGTGRSPNSPGPWTAADLAAVIQGLMEALDIDRAIVGGISLDGVVSSQFGLDYPDRVHALIVGGTVPYPWPLRTEWLQQQIAAARRQGPVIVRQARCMRFSNGIASDHVAPHLALPCGVQRFSRHERGGNNAGYVREPNPDDTRALEDAGGHGRGRPFG